MIYSANTLHQFVYFYIRFKQVWKQPVFRKKTMNIYYMIYDILYIIYNEAEYYFDWGGIFN